MVNLTLFQKSYLDKLFKFHNILKAQEQFNVNQGRELVLEFQSQKKLATNGILDQATLWELQYDYVLKNPLSLVTVPADVLGEGFNNFVVRSDIKDRYMELYNEMHQVKAIVPSSGSLRALNAQVSAGRSATSFHYSGLALDFYIWGGLQNPDSDPFVVEYTEGGQKVWTVYAASHLESIPTKTVKACYLQGNKLAFKEVNRPLISFTKLMNSLGFSSINPRSPFIKDPKTSYLSAEWWHFQDTLNVMDKLSLFGIELLKIYSESALAKSPVWKFKNSVYSQLSFSSTYKDFLDFN